MKINQLKQLIREDLARLDRNKTTMENMERNHLVRSEYVVKSVQSAETARSEGNDLYGKVVSDPVMDYKILYLYNQSIAFAPLETEELAKAYGNKSALLRRMLKFENSVTEADKALSITKSTPLKIRLLCRKAECFTDLLFRKNSSEIKKCLTEAKALLATLEESDKKKKKLDKMIDRTQSFIDNFDERSSYRANISEMARDVVEMQAWKILQEAEETTSIQTSFKIEYSKQYGHHLVAARDFEPGEIMCVEEPYHNQILDSKTPNSYCCQCVKFLWTIVPCDHCPLLAYCSERCKIEAWNDHHDIECEALKYSRIITFLKEDYSPEALFFKALKEAGSVSQLQTDMELLEKCDDHSSKDLLSEEKFMSYKTLHLASIREFEKKELDDYIRKASLALIGLVYPVLKPTYEPYNLKELMKDESALLIGAFLCKLRMFSMSKTRSAKLVKAILIDGSINNIPPMVRAVVMTSALTPMSCVPNIGHCHVSNNQFFMYALEPIKAGSQIFAPKAVSSIYNKVPKAQRQFFHQREYQIPCNCRACTDDWDGILAEQFGEQRIPEGAGKIRIWKEAFTELICLRKEIEAHHFYRMNLVDENFIARIRKVIVKIWEHFPMPHQLTFEAVSYMMELFGMFFPCNSQK